MKRNRKPLPRRSTWEERVQIDIKLAEQMLLKQGAVQPMFVIHSDAQSVAVGTGWNNDNDKDTISHFLRILCIAEDAIAVSFIGEAWVRSVRPYAGETKAETEARVFAVRPQDAEDRREIIIAEMVWRDADNERHVLVEQRGIERGWDGKPCGVTPMPSLGGDAETYSSRWDHLVPVRAPTTTEKIAARAILARMKDMISVKGIA